MIDIGTAVADMWTKIGVKVTLKHYEWGAFAPLVNGDQPHLVGTASMYRTVGRPDAAWRYNAAFSSDSQQKLIGDKTTCDDTCKEFDRLFNTLISERDATKRTDLSDKMLALIADTWTAVPLIEGMGYYAINTKQVGRFVAIPGRHELGDAFERIPRADEVPWKK
jgi:ABC-type transport system substrate-binding protein